MSSINEKLTRIDNSISSLKSTLNISQNAEIEAIEKKIIPDVGFVIKEYDKNGYPTEIKLIGMTNLPDYAFGAHSTGDNYLNLLTKNLKKVILSDEITTVPYACFQNITTLEEVDFRNVTAINKAVFYKCSNLKIKTLPDSVHTILGGAFRYSGITQLSMNGIVILENNGMSHGPFGDCSNLKAIWIGDKLQTISVWIFTNCTNLNKIFINLPRTKVETLSGYSKAFCDDANKINCIVCNDDPGFISKEEFDTID